ncbi:AlpA family phage regulatory protein [Ignatzschineria larvae DSM 13226]|uniref:AlpA family phage regulatory protein n=1 Tax=Ignatzschineria larvae DSM 13226 TaxID=1111732 RepID=A0ABZ3BX28_9GAMM|nr:AlpA family phage regulatory protein [Ignatzschineria larvae]
MSGLNAIQDLIKSEQQKEQANNESMEKILSTLSAISIEIKKIKQPDELLEIKDVCEIIKFKHDWVYRNIRLGLFPAPIKINTASRWYRSEIDQWLESQKSYRVN